MLQHHAVVGGDVRLTLRRVDDEGVHLAQTGADLDMGGEAGAAHAGDARFPDDVHDLLSGELGVVGMGGEFRGKGVLEIVLDDHGEHLPTATVGTRLNGHHFAGHAGVDGSAQASRLGDLLAHRHLISHLHHRRAGCAHVHGHGEHHLSRGIMERFHRLGAGQLLPLLGMHAAIEG